jgi:hypothetical protein
VIVFIDANSLMQDPMCGGAVWQVMAHAPASWELELVTSEVAVAEAVAGYQRAIAEAVTALGKAARSWGRLGAQGHADAARVALEQKAGEYHGHLMDSLSAVGVNVLAAPDVPHMELVARSVARTPPCDDQGNGYRDTLIWMTLLRLAADRTDAHITLVTNDADFMDSERTGLHPDLCEDLDVIDARDRVDLQQALADVVLDLAQRNAGENDVKALRAELRDETVRQYIESLLGNVVGRPLDLRMCALPSSQWCRRARSSTRSVARSLEARR